MSDTSYSYHNRIMNIQSDTTDMEGDVKIAYKYGHRDARHAAAEIAIEAEREIEELKETVASLEEALTGAENYSDYLLDQLM